MRAETSVQLLKLRIISILTAVGIAIM
jgi:hypothetical protein